VQYRLRWYERALLGCGVLVGLFLAVVSLGAFGFVVTRSLDGTLLSPVERTATAIGTYFAIALFALWFGSFQRSLKELARPDPRSAHVFGADIRGKTDRFINGYRRRG
jgi:hypothetical protein